MNDSKVTPVEAQAVPAELSEVLEFLYGAAPMDGKWIGEGPPLGQPRYWWRSKLRNAIKAAFTRPTPAAVDLHQQIHSVHLAGDEAGRTSVEGGVNAPSAEGGSSKFGQLLARARATPEYRAMRAELKAEMVAADAKRLYELAQAVIDSSTNDYTKCGDDYRVPARQWLDLHAQVLHLQRCLLTPGYAEATSSAAELVAASPAAAAGATGFVLVPREPTDAMLDASLSASDIEHYGLVTLRAQARAEWEAMLASSPVAPVGAPTETLLYIKAYLQERDDWQGTEALIGDIDNALSAQGCELATDATKQQRETMFNGLTQEETDATASVMGLVHLAATPIDQDFRRRPASSEAAPSAGGGA